MLNLGKSHLAVALASITLAITGCLPDTDSDSESSTDSDKVTQLTPPQAVTVNSLQLTDIDFSTLQGVDLAILNGDQVAATSSVQLVSNQLSDENGIIQLFNPLTPGNYTFQLSKNSQQPIEVSFEVLEGNASAVSNLPVPVDAGFNLQQTLAFGAISGVIYGEAGPLEQAVVSLSGGAATNGVFRSTQTNAQGEFNLTFNFQPLETQEQNNALLAALQQATLQASKAGFQSQSKTVNLTQGSATGQNLGLPTASQQNTTQAIWSDDFSNSQNFWTTAGGFQSAAGTTAWTTINLGHGLRNQLWQTAVKPGQGDTSEGYLPQPRVGTTAWWFGNPASGNFIGERLMSGEDLDGGESNVEQIRGTLTSGAIQLPSSGNASLTFQTWWEIESVNPNQDGFDWMEVQVAVAGSNNFTTLARLNPLADPVSTLDRRPLPFSTGGFNQAPVWIQQEGISLDDYLGEYIQLRFVFDTQDEFYNGFRGWVLDDLKILPQKGTHPPFVPDQGIWDEPAWGDDNWNDEDWMDEDWTDGDWDNSDWLNAYCNNLAEAIDENAHSVLINHYENMCGNSVSLTRAPEQQPAAIFNLNPQRQPK